MLGLPLDEAVGSPQCSRLMEGLEKRMVNSKTPMPSGRSSVNKSYWPVLTVFEGQGACRTDETPNIAGSHNTTLSALSVLIQAQYMKDATIENVQSSSTVVAG